MTKDEIILMADASGLSFYGMGNDRDKFLHYLEAFAALVAERKREACAVICEAQEELRDHTPFDAALRIRARGEKV